MVLKVDLQCWRCYRKIKKVLCKFPQIRDQIFDEKTNTIKIKVVCCSPEKIKQKIICKAGDTLKSIEIKEPEIPKPKDEKKKEEPKKDEPKKEKPKDPPGKPKERPKDKMEKSDPNQPKQAQATAPAPALPKLQPAPVCYPPPAFGTCSSDCYHGNTGGPYYGGYGGPPPQCYQYDGYCGRPVYDSYGGGTSYTSENPGACSIM